jgi:hypothetical protein
MTVGNAERALDGANRAADTGADDSANCAADGAGDPVAFVGAFLGAADDALSMASWRQDRHRKKDGSGGECQARGQTGRQSGGGDTGFVHLRSRGR